MTGWVSWMRRKTDGDGTRPVCPRATSRLNCAGNRFGLRAAPGFVKTQRDGLGQRETTYSRSGLISTCRYRALKPR
jgi:hypothetical protein